MIELIVIAALGGLCALFASRVQVSSDRNYRPQQEEPQEPPIELACVGMCIASRGRNLTGYQPRTADEQAAVTQAMEWTQDDAAQLAAGYEVDRITQGRGWERDAIVQGVNEWIRVGDVEVRK